MVEAHYFYSTLAQASAAIVGFIIAVAAALYSLERQRVERRTNEYRDALTELRNRYGFALMTLDSMLKSEGAETTPQMSDDLSLDSDELEDLVYEEYKHKPVTSLFLAHVQRILGIFNQIEPESDYTLSTSELDSLNRSVTWLYRHCYHLKDTPDSTIQDFVEEVTGKPYSDQDDSATIQLFGDSEGVQGFHAFQLEKWFRERQAIDTEILRPNPTDEETDEISDKNDYLTGDNFWSLKTLSEYLMHDFRKVRREASGTVIDYESGIRPVVKISTYLILVGVILPTMFLFSSPVTLPLWLILMSQILLLTGVLILSLTLIDFVLRSVEPTNQMGDKENLSRLSSTVMNLLPDLPA